MSQAAVPRMRVVMRRGELVSPLELFFDLVFVLAITQCTALMARDPTWTGLGRGLLVLGLLWWSWVGYAWLTSVVDPDEGPVRLVLFVAMAAVLVASLCVPHAFGNLVLAEATVGEVGWRDRSEALELRGRDRPMDRPGWMDAWQCPSECTVRLRPRGPGQTNARPDPLGLCLQSQRSEGLARDRSSVRHGGRWLAIRATASGCAHRGGRSGCRKGRRRRRRLPGGRLDDCTGRRL